MGELCPHGSAHARPDVGSANKPVAPYPGPANVVYRFGVHLRGTDPPIWRLIDVPAEYRFWDLHVAIQDAMGWLDYHLHEFSIAAPDSGVRVTIGIPDSDFGYRDDVLPDSECAIADYFRSPGDEATYVYDFGDGWQHQLALSRVLARAPGVRKAMSYALNRNDINELVYGGLAGPPSQVVPFPESPFHLAELASAYVEYDPEQANAMLDEMGLTGRDGNGFRLRPDAETMSLTVEITDGFADVGELTREYWEAVGVKTNLKVIERSLWQQRYVSNDMDVSMWSGTAGMMPLTWPRYYVPTGGQVLWAPDWQFWYESGGERGEEPPDFMKQAIALYDEIKVTVDPAKQHELFKDILRIKVDHLWDIGLWSPPPPIVGVVNAKLRNVPERAPYSDIARSPGSFIPEQFFYAE